MGIMQPTWTGRITFSEKEKKRIGRIRCGPQISWAWALESFQQPEKETKEEKKEQPEE